MTGFEVPGDGSGPPGWRNRLELLARRVGTGCSLDVSAEQVRDALWLSPFLPESIGTPEQALEPTTPIGTEPAPTPQLGVPQPVGLRPVAPPDARPHPEEPPSNVPIYPRYQSGSSDTTADSGRAVPASVLEVVCGPALPDARAIARALRPLMRRVPSRTRVLLDESATAERLAEDAVLHAATGRWVSGAACAVVTRPAPERWLDVMLVFDDSSSMVIWKETARELRDLMSGQGAFRDVRLWWLSSGTGSVALRPDKRVPSDADRHSPREILSGRGDRLILIVTDCVAPSWRGEALLDVVARWASCDATAILQVLPSRMWTGTAIGRVDELVSAGLAGAPTSRLVREPLPSRRFVFGESIEKPGDRNRSTIPIPIADLDPESIGRLARVVAGLGRARLPATRWAWRDEEPPGERSPRQLVQDLQATADPTTQRLAGYFSLMPLNLSVLRLVQAVMLPAPLSRQSHLAEFLTSGLVRRDRSAEAVAGEPVFDFVDASSESGTRGGLRELLQRTVRRSEALRLQREVMSYIESSVGMGKTRGGLYPNAGGTETLVLNKRTMPFVQLQAEFVSRTGTAEESERLWHHVASRRPAAVSPLFETPESRDVYFRAAWSPTGGELAAPTRDGRILVWSRTAGRYSVHLELRSSEFGVNEVAWSRDGRLLAAACYDRIVRVWSYPEGVLFRQFDAHRSDVRTLVFRETPTRLLATGSSDGTILLTRLDSATTPEVLDPGRGAVHFLSWSPDSETLAFACDDGTVGLHRSRATEPLRLFREHARAVRCVLWSSEGGRLVSGSSGGDMIVWRRERDGLRVEQRVAAHDGGVNSLSSSHDGRVIASKSSDGTVKLWRGDSFDLLGGFDEPSSQFTYPSAVFHPREPVLATTGANDRALRFWEIDIPGLLRARQSRARSTHAADVGPQSLASEPVSQDVAVVIAAGRYEAFAELPSAVIDARLFHQWLCDPKGRAMSADRAILLQSPALMQIVEVLTRVAPDARRGRLYLYFRGHTTGKGLGTRLMGPSGPRGGPDGLAVDRLLEMLNSQGFSDAFIVIDGDNLTRLENVEPPAPSTTPTTVGPMSYQIVIASRAGAPAARRANAPGAFTSCLVEGLSGAADGDESGRIGPADLAAFLNQHPTAGVRVTFELHGAGKSLFTVPRRPRGASVDSRWIQLAEAYLDRSHAHSLSELDEVAQQLRASISKAEGVDEKTFAALMTSDRPATRVVGYLGAQERPSRAFNEALCEALALERAFFPASGETRPLWQALCAIRRSLERGAYSAYPEHRVRLGLAIQAVVRSLADSSNADAGGECKWLARDILGKPLRGTMERFEFLAERRAREYDSLRKGLSAGAERTRLMNELFSAAGAAVEELPVTDPKLVTDMFDDGRQGNRIVALAWCWAAPMIAPSDVVARAIAGPLTFFEQWAALLAALAMSEQRDPEDNIEWVHAVGIQLRQRRSMLNSPSDESRRSLARQACQFVAGRLQLGSGSAGTEALLAWVSATPGRQLGSGRCVAIFGSSKTQSFNSLCLAVGSALALHGWSVVAVDGAHVAGTIVAEGFLTTIRSGSGEAGRLTLYSLQDSQPVESHRRAVSRIVDARQMMMASADCALVIGGAGGTRREAELAMAKGIPVLPIAVTGGTAKTLAHLSTELTNRGVPAAILRRLAADSLSETDRAETAVRALGLLDRSILPSPPVTPPAREIARRQKRKK